MNKAGFAGHLPKIILPFFLCAFAILLSAAPKPFSWLPTAPHILLSILFFCSIYAPKLLPITSLFILGLITDIVLNAPLGLHASLLIIMQIMLKYSLPILVRQSFVVLWGLFAIVALIYFGAMHLLLSWQYHSNNPVMGTLKWLGSTVLCYPLIHSILARLLRNYTAN
jgi:rod shape-determining protein MreD